MLEFVQSTNAEILGPTRPTAPRAGLAPVISFPERESASDFQFSLSSLRSVRLNSLYFIGGVLGVGVSSRVRPRRRKNVVERNTEERNT